MPDPLWEDVTGYMGPIRNYNPDDWTYLKQEDILEIDVQVVLNSRVYAKSLVLEYADLNNAKLDILDYCLTRIVGTIDDKIRKYR